jgi:uncharacterized protein YutE (UPF0331/DUF86 family)
LVDHDLILSKASSLRRHLGRVREKSSIDFQTFSSDLDCQESILFNLQMAVQNCIDIAAHIVSEEGFGVPGSTSELFYLLEENGYLDPKTTETMVRSVGFRNLVVHEYGKLELNQVFEVTQEGTKDLDGFLVTILNKLGISA